VILIGVRGVGKSAVAQAVGGALTSRGLATAVVDTDQLAQFGPPRSDRPGLHDELKCRNLAAVWCNFRAAGAQYLVVSAGIESAELAARYAAALGGDEIRIVRLTAEAETVRDRLRRRGSSSSADVPTAPTEEFEDFSVVNDRTALETALKILARLAW
jgi:predicted kinase